MATLTFADQAATARLAADRIRRSAMARAMRSRLLRWQFGPPIAEELLLVPQELRTADPSFADEHAQGLFGLGGAVAHIGEGSVFDLPPPSTGWSRELHGFGWLRHLRAADAQDASRSARDAVLVWIARYGSGHDRTAWLPDVIARRIMSWIANADILLQDSSPEEYDRITDSLGAQLIRLSASWGDTPTGYPRLICLTALMMGSLCIAGHDKLADITEPQLNSVLEAQLLDDGGHICRNPAVVIDILLDLLPLRTCFQVRRRPVSPAFEQALLRMLRFVRFLRLGDGSLGRFNGMGASPFDSLATLLGYDPAPDEPLGAAPSSRYAKLARGATIILADIGPPPPLTHAAHASAGALSFELSVGTQPVFVNGGTPGPADEDWLSASRATASHNTLTLGARSSAQMVKSPLLSRLIGGTPLRFPNQVEGTVATRPTESILECHHNGYLEEFSLIHKRRLMLDASGTKLAGEDSIVSGRSNTTRLRRDIPYAIHFHLHPDLVCRHGEDPNLATIQLPDGKIWYFRSEKATLSIEDSIHFADLVGPRNAQQIVLRGACFGDTSIRWSFSRLGQVA
jgi:uncharacterized heparinase superfamily protein